MTTARTVKQSFPAQLADSWRVECEQEAAKEMRLIKLLKIHLVNKLIQYIFLNLDLFPLESQKLWIGLGGIATKSCTAHNKPAFSQTARVLIFP